MPKNIVNVHSEKADYEIQHLTSKLFR